MRPTQRCSSYSWLRAQPFLRRPVSDSGAASFATTIFCLDFHTPDRGRCYTIGFRHPNFHPMAPEPPGVWNIQSFDFASGVATAPGLPGIPRQAAYNREDLVWSVVNTSDVVVYGLKTLSSYRGEPLTMQRLSSPESPCPGSWPAASGSSTLHLITVLSSALAGQKSVKTSCMRR